MTSTPHNFANFDPARVPSPCYVIDLAKLEDNLRVLRRIADEGDVRILLALKAFSCFAVADLVSSYLDGTAASGLWEARLGRNRFGGELHSFVPGLKPDQWAELEDLSDHIIFNTLGQANRYESRLHEGGACGYGLRVNPRHSEVETPLYDPCAAWSRLGALASDLADGVPDFITGMHVHALCDQGFQPFDRLLNATEERFASHFSDIDWINLGGGQLLTDPAYPVDDLIRRLKTLRADHDLETYLEPGTALALNAGVLVTEVLDKGWNEGNFAIVDCSATCHIPDVIEAPYTPDIMGLETISSPADADRADTDVLRLGGPTCLAGDVIGTYRTKREVEVGERLMVLDQAYYTMVKNSTFNGTPLPAIALWDSHIDKVEIVREFDYEIFEQRLG